MELIVGQPANSLGPYVGKALVAIAFGIGIGIGIMAVSTYQSKNSEKK